MTARLFVAPDSDDDPTIWAEREGRPSAPYAVVRRHTLVRGARNDEDLAAAVQVWDMLVAAVDQCGELSIHGEPCLMPASHNDGYSWHKGLGAFWQPRNPDGAL